MRGVVLYADGSPCPTLVLPAAALPDDRSGLVDALTGLRQALSPPDRERILKIALVGPSAHPGFDLDYRFVQCLPGRVPGFELRGSCGHSILAAVMGARRLGCGPAPRVGQAVRVRVRNNGDDVTCTPELVTADRVAFVARFQRRTPLTLRSLLLFGEPGTDLDYGAGVVRLSGVSLGNPYVFVDAAALGLRDSADLFAAGAGLFATLSAIRKAAEHRLGWPSGAFPKVAAVLADGDGLAVRAISVPSWHPTLALTGATCLAAAAAIPATVPAGLLAATTAGDQIWRRGADQGGDHRGDQGRDQGGGAGMLRITTPGGRVGVTAATTGPHIDDRLCWVSVSGKVVRFVADLDLGPDPSERSPVGGRRRTAPAVLGGPR